MATEDDAAEWRTIQAFPDYEASDDGRIRRVTRPKSRAWKNRPLPYEMAQTKNIVTGYMQVGLYPPVGRQVVVHVNRLVAMAFLPPPGPGQIEAAHNDGDQGNNRASNLRWATPLENTRDKHIHGTMADTNGELNPRAKLTAEQVRNILSRPNDSGSAMAREFGVSKSAISAIRHGRAWRCLPR